MMLVPRRIIAIMMICFFVDLALHPESYSSGSFAALRDAWPLRLWGIAITAASVLVLVTRGRYPLAILAGLLFAWTGGLIYAVFTGESQSPAGWTFMAGILALLYWGAGRAQGA